MTVAEPAAPPVDAVTERLAYISAALYALARLLHREAQELGDDPRMIAAGFSAQLAELAATNLTMTTATPAATLAAIMSRIFVRHSDMPEDEARDLLAAMLAGDGCRELLLDMAAEAVDSWMEAGVR
jgi:hypothetical protein